MNEQQLIDAYATLPPMGDEEPPPYTWERHRWGLREHVRDGNIADFLRWPTITATMWAGETALIRSELEALRGQPDWATVWEPAIRDSGVGNAPRMAGAPNTNGNMVHQAYHLMMWNKATLREVSDLGSITEFGGGYGAMALIASRLGFRGTYRLVDFSEVCLLQEHFLAQHEIACSVEFWPSMPAPAGADLFIACYSLSEVDPAERLRFADLQAATYLLTMQELWDDMDNMEWARAELPLWNTGMRWAVFPMVRPGHWYVIGGVGK